MIYLAPVQGITDRIYRNLFPVYFKGVDVAIAPFIPSVKKMKPENKLLRELHPDNNTGIPTIPQIMSTNPDDFTLLANTLYDIGCGTVNWNLGCPFPMVVKKGRGSGMLCYPDRIESFLDKNHACSETAIIDQAPDRVKISGRGVGAHAHFQPVRA